MASVRIVAVDDGFAQTKVWAADPKGGEPLAVVVPTSIRSGAEGMTALDGGIESGWYETDAVRYTVSPHVAATSTQFDDYHVSALDRVAVAHALRVAGMGGKEVDLVCGLPVGDYFREGRRNDDLVARKIANLTGRPVIAVDGNGSELPSYSRVRVVGQGVAAWVDHAFGTDLDPNPNVDLDAPVAVVDIGGRTTDVAVILQGSAIDQARTGTEKIGVIKVRERLAQALRTKYGIEPETMPASRYEAALRSRKIRIWGKEQDVSDVIAAAANEVGEQIGRFVSRLIGNGAGVDTVLFVGGGAVLFPELVARFPNAVVPEAPDFANARGMWKFAAARATG